MALLGLGFDVADFFGSNALAYTAWIVAGLWAVYLAWPLLKRWRPFTLAPAEGDSDAPRGHVFTPTVSQTESSEAIQRQDTEIKELKIELRETQRERKRLEEEKEELQTQLQHARQEANRIASDLPSELREQSLLARHSALQALHAAVKAASMMGANPDLSEEQVQDWVERTHQSLESQRTNEAFELIEPFIGEQEVEHFMRAREEFTDRRLEGSRPRALLGDYTNRLIEIQRRLERRY